MPARLHTSICFRSVRLAGRLACVYSNILVHIHTLHICILYILYIYFVSQSMAKLRLQAAKTLAQDKTTITQVKNCMRGKLNKIKNGKQSSLAMCFDPENFGQVHQFMCACIAVYVYV
jgi:hypothetical protein